MRWLSTKLVAGVIINSVCANFAAASVVLPGDGPYYRLKRSETQFIYDAEGRELVPQLESYHNVFRRMYDQSYGWTLDERQDLILTSARQQIANAYATVVPNIKSVWYPSGAGFLEESAASSWLLTLDAHETSHLYQLDAKGGLPLAAHSVFGNTPLLSIFYFPFFIVPNLLIPTFLVEGNAVLQESRINQGGRLFSGEARALVLAQIQADDINPSRLINDQFRFPFGRNPYLQGGYFQAHLATKYGLEKTNRFFLAQGQHYLWPLILNKTFRDHFGSSYPQEIREYVREMTPLARAQKHSLSTPLSRGIEFGSFNHDQNRIWFLISNGVELPELWVFDKRTKTSSTRHVDLPLGRVFFDGDEPVAVGSEARDLHHVTYSLYGEGGRFIGKYAGQIVTDQRAGKTAAMDASHSWFETGVLIDGQAYDVAHSSVILDEKGDAYYFRQNGAERVMYKNREPLFKMDGFYAKPMEVRGHTIYFIASTDLGSTLYQYKDKEISRVLASDRVVEARSINDHEFLVAEVNADGYSVHLNQAEIKSAVPSTYTYGFAMENVVPEHAAPLAQVEKDDHPYNALGALRYSGMGLGLLYSKTPGFGFSTDLNLTDPLEYNAVNFAYEGTQFRGQTAQFSYAYTKYLADIVARYRYQEEWWERLDGVDQLAYNQNVSLGLRLPVLRWRRWDATIGLAAMYEFNDAHNDPVDPKAPAAHPTDREELYGLKSGVSIKYSVPTMIGMYPWREFSIDYSNRLLSRENKWTKKHNTSLASVGYQHGFPLEFSLSALGNVAWAETKDVKTAGVGGVPGEDIVVPMMSSKNDYSVRNVESLRLEFHKVINLRGYTARIPIGLDRLAPFVAAQGTLFDDDVDNRYPQNTVEWGYGADFQFLLLHKAHVVARLMMAEDTRDPGTKDSKFQLTYKQGF